MKNRKLRSLLIVLFIFYLLHSLFLQSARAVCPVCTVAVGAGLGLSRYLGIDDSITGIWIGGLIVSLSVWTGNIIRIKFSHLKKYSTNFSYIISFVFYSLITFPPLYWIGIIGNPYNRIWGFDKLIFGSVLGITAFLTGIFIDRKIRKIKGKQLFIYQKVVFPIALLVITSALVYFYGGYLYE